MGRRYDPSPAELDTARALFAYELNMFRAVTDAIFAPGLPHMVKNALLESALVHVRNLHDFFVQRPSARDDVLAAYYVHGSGESWEPGDLEHVMSCQQDINKSLSHLTFHRVVSKPQWHIGELRREIESTYSSFVRALPPDERTAWLVVCAIAPPGEEYPGGFYVS